MQDHLQINQQHCHGNIAGRDSHTSVIRNENGVTASNALRVITNHNSYFIKYFIRNLTTTQITTDIQTKSISHPQNVTIKPLPQN